MVPFHNQGFISNVLEVSQNIMEVVDIWRAKQDEQDGYQYHTYLSHKKAVHRPFDE